MPWLTPEKHVCAQRPLLALVVLAKNRGPGDIWQCSECNTLWMLSTASPLHSADLSPRLRWVRVARELPNTALEAAGEVSYVMVEAFKHGWEEADSLNMQGSRSCGGSWAWAREREPGTWIMVGCVCHHLPTFRRDNV